MQTIVDKSSCENSKNNDFFLLSISENSCDIRSSIKDWYHLSSSSNLQKMISIVVSIQRDRFYLER